MAKILIIDDDPLLCKVLARKITKMGHEARSAYTLDEGYRQSVAGVYDVVFLDVRMPDGNGLKMLPSIRDVASRPEVIIMTGAGDPKGAELAIKNGAWDYIEKPSSMEDIVLHLARALQYRDVKNAAGSGPAGNALKRDGIVGGSATMRACLDQVAQAALSDANVLITGETGTGKELFARAIHINSMRAHRNFVIVDCAALTSTLVESVLFGYEKGAYTGADQSRDGLIMQADGGTLFLDEIGELPLVSQKAFLRVLQEHSFRPLGRKQEVRSNFRLVAATNKDLDQMVRDHQFRSDLLFRLRSFTIELPPLRKHPEDIPELADYFMMNFVRRNRIEAKKFSPEFIDALAAYDWPGNIRELMNTLERAFTVAKNENVIFPTHLPTHIRIKLAQETIKKHMPETAASVSEDKAFPNFHSFRNTINDKAERQYLENLFAVANDNIKKACEISGLSRSRLYQLMKKHGMT
jgi:two-component system NtrC family response regulator